MTNEYIAGFFDGEGSVYVSQGRALKRGGKQYFLCASLNNTNKPVLVAMRRLVGGALSYTAQTETKKGVWRLRLYSLEAANLLRAMLPYLVIKQRQARLAIQFQEQIAVGLLSESAKASLKRRISAFNQKGPRKLL